MWVRDWENAIALYFKMPTYVSRQMKEGREWHQKWAEETRRTGRLPEVFGGRKLIKPQTELKIEIPNLGKGYEWLQLVGVIDAIDDGVIYEYKTGVSESNSYVGSFQAGIYAILAASRGLEAKQCQIHHYNQYRNKSDMSIFWITPKMLAETDNWIKTIAGEMFQYFKDNDLWARFGGPSEKT